VLRLVLDAGLHFLVIRLFAEIAEPWSVEKNICGFGLQSQKKQTSHTSIFFFFYADFSTFANGDKEPNICFLGKFGPQTETIANANANANGTNNAPENWELFCAAGAHEHNRVSGTSCAAGRKSLRVLHCTVP
jgi:hypothetical protein